MTKEMAIKIANDLIQQYPNIKTVHEMVDELKQSNKYTNNEILIIWGRLMRLLPVGA